MRPRRRCRSSAAVSPARPSRPSAGPRTTPRPARPARAPACQPRHATSLTDAPPAGRPVRADGSIGRSPGSERPVGPYAAPRARADLPRRPALPRLRPAAGRHARPGGRGRGPAGDRRRGGGREVRAAPPRPRALLARERIELLLDPDSPFLELRPLAGVRHRRTVGRRGGDRHRGRRRRRVRGRGQRPDRAGRRGRTRRRGEDRCGRTRSRGRTGCRWSTSSSRPAPTCPSRREIFVPGGAGFRQPHRAVRRGHPDGRAGVRPLDRRRRLRARA